MGILTRPQFAEREAELQNLYRQCVDKFMDRWQSGLYERIGRNNPDLLSQINQTEDTLNAIWIKAREGKASKAEFVKALKDWGILHLQAISSR